MFFHVTSKLGKKIKASKTRWQLIVTTKYPEIKNKENEVQETRSDPDVIRLSNSDKSVYLYYKKYEKLSLAVVVKHLNGEGFIITTYLTDRIKEGEQIFRRQP